MSSLSITAKTQVTLAFDPAIAQNFSSLRDYVQHRVQVQAKPLKTIAADMDLSPSTLSRKLAPNPGDTQRFNTDDLEAYMRATGDLAALEYLASKYLCSDASRVARAIETAEALMRDMGAVVSNLRELHSKQAGV